MFVIKDNNADHGVNSAHSIGYGDLVRPGPPICDIADWGVTLNDAPVKFLSRKLAADIFCELAACTPTELQLIADAAVDTAQPGEPTGWLMTARTPWADSPGAIASGRENRIWLERFCDGTDGWSMIYPDER